MQNYCYILLLLFIALAWRKNNEEPYKETYPVDYNGYEWKAGPIRLFTKNGEIKNTDTIGAFIEQQEVGNYFYFGTQLVNSDYHIRMHKQDSVEFYTFL